VIQTSSALKTWKAAQSRESPWVVLYDIEVPGMTTLYLLEGDPTGTGSVTFGGHTYNATAIARDEQDQNIKGDVGEFSISISNVTGVAAGYLESYEFDGGKVTITQFPLSLLEASEIGPGVLDRIREVYTIQDQSYDRQRATLVVGPPNFFRRKLPWRKYIRQRCQWDWENRFSAGNGCGYPSDLFLEDTRQDFRAGATLAAQERRFGWHTLNAASAKTFENDGLGLTISVDIADAAWNESERDAPFAYKSINGDFDVSTEVDLQNDPIGSLCGILCQEDFEFQSWVFIGKTHATSTEEAVRFLSCQDGVITRGADVETDSRFLRLRRQGDVFTGYYSLDGTTWAAAGSAMVSFDYGYGNARVGLCVSSESHERGDVGSWFRNFRFSAGGLSSCDRTLEDCRAHGNTHRILAFHGILRT
jgi:phage-related protein